MQAKIQPRYRDIGPPQSNRKTQNNNLANGIIIIIIIVINPLKTIILFALSHWCFVLKCVFNLFKSHI